jgi:chromate transporter
MMGGFFAWLGFTLPSALALTVFAILMKTYKLEGQQWIYSLKLVAVVIVTQAAFSFCNFFRQIY